MRQWKRASGFGPSALRNTIYCRLMSSTRRRAGKKSNNSALFLFSLLLVSRASANSNPSAQAPVRDSPARLREKPRGMPHAGPQSKVRAATWTPAPVCISIYTEEAPASDSFYLVKSDHFQMLYQPCQQQHATRKHAQLSQSPLC